MKEFIADCLLETLRHLRCARISSREALAFLDSRIDAIIQALIEIGEYPPQARRHSIRTMVDFWGVRWHQWKHALSCPHCKAELRDLLNGPPFKREIGIIIADRLDHYRCPDCGGTWDR